MKLFLSLEQNPNNRTVFTSCDDVRGVAGLHLSHKTAISNIVLSLTGRLEVSLRRKWTAPGDWDWAVDEHKILEVSQTIFPPPNVPLTCGGYTLPKGTHSFPFEVRFPILSTCHRRRNGQRTHHVPATLPPSFVLKSPDGNARIQYWLKVRVWRPGQLQRDRTMEQHLSFSPLDPILPPPTLDLAVGTQSGRGVVLEAALPSPSVLFVGRSLPLRLFLRDRRLHMGSNSPRIALRSLAIAIQMKTTMAIGLDRNTWTSNRIMVSVSAMEPPRGDFCASMDGTGDQLLEISSDLWKHATVPVLPSSFTTCAVRRQYSVVVTVGLVSSSGEALDLVDAIINVEVHSGIAPPLGVTVVQGLDEHYCNEETGLIPWRVGSENHLGIGRCSTIGTGAVQPPPYA